MVIGADPKQRPARVSLCVVALGLLACSRGSVDPRPFAEPPTAAAAATTPPAATPAPAPVVAVAPVPEDMPQAPAAPGPPQPLSAEQRAAFLAPAEDEPPPELGGVTEARKNQHYVTGNERTLEAFYPRIRGLGGAYVGVGSDQSYLMIGWARAELAWLIDYDPVVVDLHAVYHALFGVAATPDEFLALWRKENKPRAIAALHAAYPGPAGVRRELLYRRYRARVAKRLDELHLGMTAAGVPTFLTDAETYTHVRDLIAAGRVRAMVADLTGEGAVRQVGAAAKTLATPIRVLYLSNAEEYWSGLPRSFRDNIAALHVDDGSVVLRTLLTWEINQDYRYNAQPTRSYQQWLAQPWVRTIYDVVRRKAIVPGAINFFETTDLPDEAVYRKRQERRARSQAPATAPAPGL